ncbi:AraC family transcriptional regulator [Alteromonas sediminis]|uniref:AraC family transcriptional regulator n=1 Tax=Alteromonas sediminis TaxID=2259342 RepID=A0A3N5XY60_9ALTE|nr:helix-turn-helix domain-containing protein [Alteromonas sediminis]RPJ65842.1 AraC family transcriptional regulator [Alteromonas sediminis]
MNHTFLGIAYFIAFSHACLMAFSLFSRSDKNGAGKILALMVLIMGYKLFEGGVLYTQSYTTLGHFMGLLPGAALLFGPVFFLYTCKVTGYFPLALRYWPLHFIPAAALWLYQSEGLWRSLEEKSAMWDNVLASTGPSVLPVAVVAILIGMKIHLGTYLWFSWRSIGQFEDASESLRADNSHALLVRLRVTVMALFALEAVWVLLFLAQQFAGIITLSLVSDIWLLCVAFFVLTLGYFGLQKPDLVFEPEEKTLYQTLHSESPQAAVTDEGAEKVKYLHSALPENTLNAIASELETKIKQQQLYLDDKLSLTKLANITEIRSHTLSQVINQSMNTNFYKLINGYRVQHAVALIDDNNIDWPLERIALESGFGNRVTFVKAFKDVMQYTPSAYKKRSISEEKTGT